MHLPLFFHGLTGASPLRPALQAAIVAAAAVAGYVTFLPLSPRPSPAGVMADVEQPQWAGHIERPDMDAARPSAPITSASYVVPEAASLDNTSKKSGAAVAVIPKVIGKPVLPPRRPAASDDAAARMVAPAPTGALTPPAGTPVPPAPIPLVTAAAETPAKPVSRNMFSPVTDRLPATGNLLKPFHVVGDAFHNLIRSF